MAQPTAEVIAALESQGWTVECESPFEIRHDETGSFATHLAAQLVADTVLAELASELEEPPRATLAPAEAFAAFQALVEQARKYVSAAQSLGHDDGTSSEASEAWETAFELVFSDDIRGQATQLLERLGKPDFSWDDPDASYEDDVQAYVTALETALRTLVPFFT
jgi:hypothetical protein